MKTYRNITNSNQVQEGDILVEFEYNSNRVRCSHKVNEVRDNGILILCKSGFLMFVSNEDLEKYKEYSRAY